MKNAYLFFATLFFLSVCTRDAYVSNVYLSQNNATLTAGNKLDLGVIIVPENAVDKTVSWKSNKPEIASVSSKGQVTAVAPGAAVITVTTRDGNKTADCAVTVNKKIIDVTPPPLEADPVIVAYVISGVTTLPDPTYITHINYAFGEVNDNFNGIKINNESRLMAISGLKAQKPSLKVLLAIGGWGKGGFSEMAANEIYRKAFVADCKRVVEQFNLDGIDMDWEYPTSSEAGISSSPEDTYNFTLLMCEIREILGKDKLLTFASSSTAGYVDFKAVEPYVDFINIMAYDMGMPPYHHAGLYPSAHTRRSAEESVNLHINAGIAPDKLTLGIPFYGKGLPNIRFQDIPSLTDYTEQWDDVAKAPYLTNAAGEFVFTYENARSIALKCEFLKKKGLLGAMYWQYNHDDSTGTLRKAVYNGVMNIKQ